MEFELIGLDTLVSSLCRAENTWELVSLVIEMVHFVRMRPEKLTKSTSPYTNKPRITLPTFPERDLKKSTKALKQLNLDGRCW